jgi:adenine deaminase
MSIAEQARISLNLTDVAMGRKPADLVIRGGKWVCVQSGEIVPDTDLAVSGGRIAYVGPDASHTIGEATQVIQAEGRYLAPGLLDGHMHVESGMLTVTEFVRAILPSGTTGIFIDPHEIANVFGLDGIRLMVDEAAVQPIHVWVQIPSCVPSAPGFETPGASLSPEDIAQALEWPGVIGLGEVMNFPAVINSDPGMHAELAAARLAGKVIGGHYPSRDLGLPFHGYAAGGADDDHEGTRSEDAIARVRQGMKAMLRYGSAWHDVVEGIKGITQAGLDARHFILCTDDVHCGTLVSEGHVNRAVTQAIEHGLPPMIALQMCTINTAEHFGVSKDVGMIAPGRFADIILLNDLREIKPEAVIVKGQVAANQGQLLIDIPPYPAPGWSVDSVHLSRNLVPADFAMKIGPENVGPTGTARAHVIGVIENQAPTKHLVVDVPLTDSEVIPSNAGDLAKIAVIERHKHSGRIQLGLVVGFGFNVPCAVATTVAHDSHQLIVVGTDDGDMALAVNELRRIGGGQIVVKQGEVIGKVSLPIGGLMSNQRADEVARQAGSVLEGFRACGCVMNNPNMQLSLLGLVVIPELRISDLGLVDVERFEFIPVIE